MAYTGHIKPTNTIVAAGTPLVQELKVEAAANMYPGRLVIKGTNDDDVSVAGAAAANCAGWLGYEQTAPAYRPSTPDTIYVINDQAAVLNGGGFVVVGTLTTSQTIAKGAKLESGADGTLQALAAGTLVGYAEESVTTTGATADIMTRSVI